MVIKYYQMGLGCVCIALYFQVYEFNEYLPIKMSLLLLLHIGGPQSNIDNSKCYFETLE